MSAEPRQEFPLTQPCAGLGWLGWAGLGWLGWAGLVGSLPHTHDVPPSVVMVTCGKACGGNRWTHGDYQLKSLYCACALIYQDQEAIAPISRQISTTRHTMPTPQLGQC